MAKSARARSTCAAGALSERLRRVSSWRSSAVSGRRGSFRWRDMGHLGARGSPRHDTRSHDNRPTRSRTDWADKAGHLLRLVRTLLETNAFLLRMRPARACTATGGQGVITGKAIPPG